jgi:glycogen(starch) synthase
VGQAIRNPEGATFFHVAPPDATEAGARLVRKWRPDVLHVHSSWLWPVAHAIRQQTGTPIVFTVHSLDREEYEHGVFFADWQNQEMAMAAADRVIAISRSEKELIDRYCPECRGRVRIVGNGIDDTVEARRATRRDRRTESPIVLYSGRFVARKGIHELLSAIPIVLKGAPDTRFVLVGGYGGGAEVERTWMVDSLLAYRSRVHFTGWLTPTEVARWYGAADVLVVPSWYEPFGMVILEGMLHGLPVAASHVGGPKEILEHKRTGLLFPPQDALALAHAVLQFIEDPDLGRQIGGAAAEEVRRKWLWPQIVQRMGTVYHEVGGKRKDPGPRWRFLDVPA